MKDSKGWDGKLRVGQHAEITNPEALEDPEHSDPEAPPVEEIEADEGMSLFFCHFFALVQGRLIVLDLDRFIGG